MENVGSTNHIHYTKLITFHYSYIWAVYEQFDILSNGMRIKDVKTNEPKV